MFSRSKPVDAPAANLFWPSAIVLVLACLLGGGRGSPGDRLVQLAALLLLARLAWLVLQGSLERRGPAWVACLPLLAIALPVLQLLPVPEALWTLGPARAQLAAQMGQAGVVHSATLSLNPAATERALWSLAPACAVFLSVLWMPASSQRKLLGVLIGIALLNFLLGLAQLGDGEQSSLRLYRPTNPLDAVGFFANRNHFASLLVMALPPTVVGTAWLVSERLGGREINPLLPIAGISLMALLILGIVLGRSRAGLLLGMLALLGCLPLVTSLRKERGTRRALMVAVAVALMLSAQFALFGMIHRLQSDPLDDGRWRYARVTRQAAAAYAPLGSGLGTFRQAYPSFEVADTPDRAIVNHAHNDYLELWLEGGWPALALLCAAALAWLRLSWSLWWQNKSPDSREGSRRMLARTAWLAASMALIHSALDYPLRTTAAMTVFALMAAIAFSGIGSARRPQAGEDRALATR